MIKLLILFSILSLGAIRHSHIQTAVEAAVIKGQVETEGKLALPADVLLNCGGVKTQVTADNEGKFLATVTPGICEIEVTKRNIQTYQRAPFRAISGSSNFIKVKLYYPFSMIITSTDEKTGGLKDEVIPAKAKFNERVEIPESTKSGLYIRIIHEGKTRKMNGVIYKNPVFTFDKIMIQADHLYYSLKNKKFVFSGDCEINNEDSVLNVKRVSFNAKDKTLQYR